VDFAVMEGAGNVFAIVDAVVSAPPSGPEAAARLLCRPYEDTQQAQQQGIFLDRLAARPLDGLIVLSLEQGELHMSVYNADGTRARTCGNGLRLLARLCADRGYAKQERFSIRTDAGSRSVVATAHAARVELGRAHVIEREWPIGASLCDPTWLDPRWLDRGGTAPLASIVSIGNLHAIAFVPDERSVELERAGRALGRTWLFAAEAPNVHVVARRDGRLCARVWERGVGETLSCGSGACAIAAAALARGVVSSLPLEVVFAGGTLTVSQDPLGALWLEGPCATVAAGRFEPRETAPT
jgi:diaminopimelate epimerase